MDHKKNQRPVIGVGIILINEFGEVLFGKRRNSHAPFWSIPGGHLELGETFEQGAIRELHEETGVKLEQLKVIGVTNNLETYECENVHSISIVTLASYHGQAITNCEPDKCEGWHWINPTELPQPHFEASRKSIELWQSSSFYITDAS